MAPLTWRNVDAPSFGNVGQSIELASRLFGNGAQSLSDALGSFSKQAQQGDSSAAMVAGLEASDPATVHAALAAGIDPRNLSPAAIDFLSQRQGVNLRNQGQGIQNATSQFNLDQGRESAARGDSYRANQPAANEILTKARALYDSGNAEQIAQGRKLIVDSSRTLTAAGISATDVLNTMTSNTAAAGEGIKMGQAIANDQDFYRERFRKDGERGILNGLVSDPTVVDAPSAIQKIQSIKDLDAQTKASLVKNVTDNAATYFPAPSVLDTLPARGASPTAILQDAQGKPRQAGGGVLPPTFQAGLDRFEGGGNYDTLYGNAQNQGRFAGTSVSNMTVGQAIDFAKTSGYGQYVKERNPRGDVATPMGRHQIVGSTLASAAKEMGLDPNTPFDAQTQDAVALHIAKQAISGPKTMAGKIASLRDQWVGLKNAPDSQVAQMVTELEGASGGSPSAPLDPSQVRNAVVDNGGVPLGTTGNPTSILSAFTGGGSQSQPVQVAATPAPAAADNSTNQPSNPQTASEPVEKTNAERNAEALRNLPIVPTGAGEAYKDTNGQLFVRSGDGQYMQIDASGIPIGGSANYQPQALAAAAKAPKAAAPTAAPAQQQPITPVQLMQNAQTVANTGVIDNLSNDLGSVEKQLAERPDKGKSFSDIVKSVSEKTGAPQDNVVDALNQIMRENSVDSDVAGILAQQSLDTRTPGSWRGLSPFQMFDPNGIAFWNDKYGDSRIRINPSKATELLKNFRTPGTDQAGANAPGVSRLNTAQNQQVAAAQVQMLQAQATALQQRVLALAASLQRNPNNPQVAEALQTAQAQLEQVNASLTKVNSSGQIAPYIRSTVGQ